MSERTAALLKRVSVLARRQRAAAGGLLSAAESLDLLAASIRCNGAQEWLDPILLLMEEEFAKADAILGRASDEANRMLDEKIH